MQRTDSYVDLYWAKSKLKAPTQMEFVQHYSMLTKNRMWPEFLN